LDDVATSFVQIARNQVHGNRGKSLLKADAVQSFQKLVGAKSSRGQALQPSVDEQIRMRFEKQGKAESMHVDEEADRMSYVRDLEFKYERKEEAAHPHLSPGHFTCKLPKHNKYLMVLGAFEQFQGAKEVIADALAIAKRLQITFVEPVLRNGRVKDPFTWQKQELVPLHMVMDVDAMKEFYPNWIDIEDFMNACAAGGKGIPRMHIERASGGTPNSTLIKSLRDATMQIVAMKGFGRTWQRDERGLASQDGVPMKVSKYIVRMTDHVRQIWGNHTEYVCVQWRQEGKHLEDEKRMQCAHALVDTVVPMVKNRKVLLLSDVRRNTSDTLHH